MTRDRYAGAGPRWAQGATLVYGPIARALVARSPHPLTGRAVLDAGAGTGAASDALTAVAARPVAFDLSGDMLAHRADRRPPAVRGDICALPLATAAVDDAVAAFVLNHLVDPAPALTELARITRPGGAVLACVFSNDNASAARDAVDEAAAAEGWVAPGWYLELKAHAIPVLGTAGAMARHARGAGLASVAVSELHVDVGVTTPEQLVDYRWGQAQFADWLRRIGAERAEQARQHAVEAARPVMAPFRPLVVFLAALRAGR